VLKAIRYLGYEATCGGRPELLSGASKIVFPGQGHFGAMMEALDKHRLLEPLRILLGAGKPFLGICLGLQLLYQGSDEAPGLSGLGLLPGRVTRFAGVFKVPHVGWSQIEVRTSHRLLRGIAHGSFAYYCHSYYGPVTAESVAVTEYGQTFAAAVAVANVWAVQFHPEKSAEVGLEVLRNFLEA
jgi:imidazole glycerol phosphate synthase glutamine amidotransferase subunit